MQKNIGAKLALYPMPVIVVGTMVEGKANWGTYLLKTGEKIGKCLNLKKGKDDKNE